MHAVPLLQASQVQGSASAQSASVAQTGAGVEDGVDVEVGDGVDDDVGVGDGDGDDVEEGVGVGVGVGDDVGVGDGVGDRVGIIMGQLHAFSSLTHSDKLAQQAATLKPPQSQAGFGGAGAKQTEEQIVVKEEPQSSEYQSEPIRNEAYPGPTTSSPCPTPVRPLVLPVTADPTLYIPIDAEPGDVTVMVTVCEPPEAIVTVLAERENGQTPGAFPTTLNVSLVQSALLLLNIVMFQVKGVPAGAVCL